MPPKKKTTSSISNAFKPSSSKAAAAVQQGKLNLARTGSLDKVKSQSSQPETRSPSPDKASRTPSGSSITLTKEQIQEAESLPELDVNARDLNGIWNEVKREKLGRVGAIHAQGQNRVHHILRAFDFDPSYGPCLGLTRLERWNRAKNLGEEPPEEVWEILNTKEGRLQEEYRESCIAGMGV